MIANINGTLRKRIARDSSLTDAEISIVGPDAWNSFCDDVDKAFRAECIAYTFYASSPIVFLSLFIAGCALCGMANNQYDLTWQERDKMRTTGGALLGASWIYLFLVCTLGIICSSNGYNKVHRVCDKHTTDRVVFKFYDDGGPERDYFRIHVKDSNANCEPEVTFVADTQPASAAERLRALEDIRDLIDAETYEVKKTEIMSSV